THCAVAAISASDPDNSLDQVCIPSVHVSPKQGSSGSQVRSKRDNMVEPGGPESLFDFRLRVHEHQLSSFFPQRFGAHDQSPHSQRCQKINICQVDDHFIIGL